MSDTAAIILAAGASTRMGSPKQVLDYRGKPLLRHAVEAAIAAACAPVIVVLGAHREAVEIALAGLPVRVAVNDRWAEGMGTSIQAGLTALDGVDVAGAILMLADQPLVTAEFLSGLVARHHAEGKAIVAAQYAGTAGVPVFFSRPAFPWLMQLAPDKGCKGVILSHPRDALLVDCPEAAVDIDTPGDYAAATGNR